MSITNKFLIGAITVALSSVYFHARASAIPFSKVTMDSLVTPVFKNEKLNAAVYDYVNTMDKYYTDTRNNQTNALSLLQLKLTTINEKIMLEGNTLSDEDLDKLQMFLDQYGRHIEQKANQHFLDEIAALEAELQSFKEANEKEAATIEDAVK